MKYKKICIIEDRDKKIIYIEELLLYYFILS